MSALPSSTTPAPASAPGGGAVLTALRFTDVFVVLAAAPFALAFGAPALGYVAGAVAWILARAAGELVSRRSGTDPKRTLMVNMVFSMGRVWALALIILLVGELATRHDGLTCAIVVIVAFTISFSMNLILRTTAGKVQSS